MARAEKSGWQRHFFYRRESWRTTWKLRFLVLFLAISIVWLTQGLWASKIGRSLTCQERIEHSDALLVENFDPDYLVFERTAALERAHVAAQAFVPVRAEAGEMASTISLKIADVMAGVAGLPNIRTIPVEETEPITLNAAVQIRDFLKKEGVRSIVVVTPGFRSRRSSLIYTSVLTPAGITVGCAPVFGITTVKNWTVTWHGIQDVGLQFLKLMYYRLYVLW